MTAHRPHPLTGPWPYGVRDATGEVAARHPWANAYAVPLAERVPVGGSQIYHDPNDALLFDGCDRCAEHARGVWSGSVDDTKLGDLWRRMVTVERGDDTEHYRTRAEGDACRTLYALACFVEHTHPQIDPWSWPWHLHLGDRSVALDPLIGFTLGSVTFGEGRT